MNRKRTSRSSKADLYRDYRREANILDISRSMQYREMRQRRRERYRNCLLRFLLFALLVFVWWWLSGR